MKGDARTMEAFFCTCSIPIVKESIKRVDGFVNLPDVSIYVQVVNAEFSRAERLGPINTVSSFGIVAENPAISASLNSLDEETINDSRNRSPASTVFTGIEAANVISSPVAYVFAASPIAHKQPICKRSSLRRKSLSA